MKTFGAFTGDGFKASIELLRFERELNNDLQKAITSIIGSSPTFIKGGAITQSGGNTTITDGIISYNDRLYTFTGGTYAGTPSTLKVLFQEATASGFPQPYFVGDPIAKNIYLIRTAKVDASGSIFLNSVNPLLTLKTLDDTKATKGAYIDIINPPSVTYNKCGSPSIVVRKYDSGRIVTSFILVTTSSITDADWLVRGLPLISSHLSVGLYSRVEYINSNNLGDPIAGIKYIKIKENSGYSELRLGVGETIGSGKILLIALDYQEE